MLKKEKRKDWREEMREERKEEDRRKGGTGAQFEMMLAGSSL